MGNEQFVFLLLAGLVGVVLTITYIVSRKTDGDQRKLQHAAMQESVSKFRLTKMLAYVGIKLEDYVTNLPHEEINHHVKRCITCPDIPSCDYCFGEGKCTGDMKFCPNFDALVTYRKMMPALKE
jgi:rRNA maturation endonuclease Nob1